MEKGLEDFLSKAVSNDPKYKTGLNVYKKKVLPLAIDDYSMLANYAMVGVIDNSQVPYWLKKLITLSKENRLFNEDMAVFLCETVSDKSSLLAISFKDKEGGLICVTGEKNEYIYNAIFDKLNDFISANRETGFIIDLTNTHLKNPRSFTLKDLMPDTQVHIVSLLSKKLESRLYNSFRDDASSVKNYMETASISDQDIPASFNDLLGMAFFYLLGDLFNKSQNFPIDFSEIENFLTLFEREPNEIRVENPNILIRDNLLKQQKISLIIEKYLLGQIENISSDNISLYLNNITNLIVFINKYKISLDWWKCQNTFNELTINTEFMEKLDRDLLALFEKTERLLGFEGGI